MPAAPKIRRMNSRRQAIKIIAFLIIALLTTAAFARGDVSPNPSPSVTSTAEPSVEIEGTSFTLKEISTMVASTMVAAMPKVKGALVHADIKTVPASELPAYAPLWYYAGGPMQTRDGVPVFTVQISESITDKDQRIHAMLSALALGAADSGAAGPKWKQLYDRELAADAALGPKALDPYRNRRALADRVVQIVDVIMSSKTIKQ